MFLPVIPHQFSDYKFALNNSRDSSPVEFISIKTNSDQVEDNKITLRIFDLPFGEYLDVINTYVNERLKNFGPVVCRHRITREPYGIDIPYTNARKVIDDLFAHGEMSKNDRAYIENDLCKLENRGQFANHLLQENISKHELQQKKSESQRILAATKIQSVFRGYRARLMLNQLQARSQSVEVIDAKDSGMKWSDVFIAIRTIAWKELKDDAGRVRPEGYVKEEYFNGTFIAPAFSSPETILLAKSGKKIVGFIITAKGEVDRKRLFYLPPDTGYVAYLAVDSKMKRSGIGTKLMLEAMSKTKALGKCYLTLEYIAEGLNVDKYRGKAKINFYNSFSTKFGIDMEEKGNVIVCRQLHVHPYYDLRKTDFNSISQLIK